jgi:predicted dehydrogenase
MNQLVLIIGTGPMALAYANVLTDLGVMYTVVGRGKESAAKFEEQTGVIPFVGGLEFFLKQNKLRSNTKVIISTGVESLMPALLSIADAGATDILVEKPAAISVDELLLNAERLKPYLGNIFVAYNRRFYRSVYEAEKIIKEDGGLRSIQFEFTEWAHLIEPLQKAPGVKENWFFANSTHVVDLAFYFAGRPKEWAGYSRSGSLSWHSQTSFVGAGITEKGILFSYSSNWESAGRWSIELLTDKRRIYLKPLEELNIQMRGSVTIENCPLNDELDKNFKPGIYNQVKAFLNQERGRLISLADHIDLSRSVYRNMLSQKFMKSK